MMTRFKTAFLAVLTAFLPAMSLLAQGTEPESVDKYRNKVEFNMPETSTANASNSGVTVQPGVSTGVKGVHYQAEPGINKLLANHKRISASSVEMEGFRIQIYAGGDQNLANESRADFLGSFSKQDMPVYQTWQPPHFRVRVGDFRTRPEALRELSNVRKIFPDAFVVSDKIKLNKSRRTSTQVTSPVPTPGTEAPRQD
jgi:SPOR domain